MMKLKAAAVYLFTVAVLTVGAAQASQMRSIVQQVVVQFKCGEVVGTFWSDEPRLAIALSEWMNGRVSESVVVAIADALGPEYSDEAKRLISVCLEATTQGS